METELQSFNKLIITKKLLNMSFGCGTKSLKTLKSTTAIDTLVFCDPIIPKNIYILLTIFARLQNGRFQRLNI